MHIIGYDIHDNECRLPIMRRLRRVTPYWQASFFVCDISEKEALSLCNELAYYLNPDCDSLLLAQVHPPENDWALAPACMTIDGIHYLE